jgi:hypothetical protein
MRLTPNMFWSEPQPEPHTETQPGPLSEPQPEPLLESQQPVIASEAAPAPTVVIDEPKTTEVGNSEVAPSSVLAPALDTKATEVCPLPSPLCIDRGT